MPRVKSILIRVEIDQAKKANWFRRQRDHRIEGDHTSLNVRSGRNWDRYCVSCAKTIIEHGIAELQELQRAFQTFPGRNTTAT